jgi:hypothetical protein
MCSSVLREENRFEKHCSRLPTIAQQFTIKQNHSTSTRTAVWCKGSLGLRKTASTIIGEFLALLILHKQLLFRPYLRQRFGGFPGLNLRQGNSYPEFVVFLSAYRPMQRCKFQATKFRYGDLLHLPFGALNFEKTPRVLENLAPMDHCVVASSRILSNSQFVNHSTPVATHPGTGKVP